MRSIILGCAVIISGLSTAPAMAAQRAKSNRVAEVIVLQSRQTSADVSKDQSSTDAPKAARETAPDTVAAAFRTHDLSRQWVEFEMSRQLRVPEQGAYDPQDPFAHVGRADQGEPEQIIMPAPPPIQIPAWMLGGSAFSAVPTSFSPGCGSVGYRPSGFLRLDTERRRQAHYDMMSAIACEYGIPVGLFDAMIIRESGYQAGIYSAKNAFGLTQLMPGTATGLGVNRYDVEGNLRGGASYLRQQLDRFGQVHLALAAYNAGPGRVRNGLLPHISETRDYVENVLLNWRRLAGFPRAAMIPGSVSETIQPVKNNRIVTVSSY